MALFSAPFSWPRYLSLARVLMAAVALAVTVLRYRDASSLYYSVLVAFLAYAVAVMIRPYATGGLFAPLALFADTVFFLIVAAHGTERSLWMAAIFFLFLLTEAIVRHGPREVLLVAALSAAFGALVPGSAVALLERTIVVGGVIAYAFAVNRQRMDQRIAVLKAEVEQAHRDSVAAVEAERLRIASDFHDGPLQNFISLQMRLEILRKLFERDTNSGMQDLRQLLVVAQEQVHGLRAFLRSMRPLEVDGSNLVVSARRTAEMFQKESGLPVTFMGSSSQISLPPEAAQEVLQMLREALANVQKHAGATRVAVAMERTDNGLEISVDDNGHGFNFAGTYSLEELELLKLGPASLKRRARSLNADLSLESRPGRGAGLKFRIPLA